MQKIGKTKKTRKINPVLKRENDQATLRLHKNLYEKRIINTALKDEPDFIKEFHLRDDYYILKLNSSNKTDCLSFLNYLIHLHKNR